MTRSSSTPRIRFTQALYLAAVVLVALSDRPLLSGLTGAVVQLGGLLVIGGAVLGRLWTSLYIAGSKDRDLVTDGPYSVSRNPLYVLSVLGAVGVGLATRSVVLTIALPVILAILFSMVVRREEDRLAALHGAEFAGYLAAVPRFLPAPGRYRARSEARVPMSIYRKAFLDAASFLLLYVLIALADLLRRGGITPGWLTLP